MPILKCFFRFAQMNVAWCCKGDFVTMCVEAENAFPYVIHEVIANAFEDTVSGPSVKLQDFQFVSRKKSDCGTPLDDVPVLPTFLNYYAFCFNSEASLISC